MDQLSDQEADAIMADPRFRKLATARSRLRWTPSGATAVIFFGFILLSSATRVLDTRAATTSLPMSMVVAFGMIVTFVAFAAFYVQQSNGRSTRSGVK